MDVAADNMQWRDRFGRPITYLRISVTDRCNLRCVYCMPAEGISLISHDQILRYEEITEIVRLAAAHGIREVRLTGGEPLVRPDLPDLVRMMASIRGIEDISLTTNGLLLEKMAQPLAEAGLKRVNVSLDTLDAAKFARITRGGSLEKVWNGIHAAEQAGLMPIKINVVVMHGINEDELIEMAKLTLRFPWQVRFIEIMPIQNQVSWGKDFPSPQEVYLSVQEMWAILAPLQLQPLSEQVGSGPARLYSLPGALGAVGFISPIGEHFCQNCNRLRLTADGHLRPCLLSDIEVPILQALRAEEDLLPFFEKAISLKPEGHELARHHNPQSRCMRQIGG